MISKYRGVIIGVLIGFGVAVTASIFGGTTVIKPDGPNSDFALGLLQLVALYIPALVILMQVLLEISFHRQDQPGRSGGVGALGPEEYRKTVLLMGVLAMVPLVMGIATIFFSIDLPFALRSASGFILAGFVFGPLILAIIVYNMWQFD